MEDQTALQQVHHGYHPDDGRLQSASSGNNSSIYDYHDLSDQIETLTARRAGADIMVQSREVDYLNRLESITTADAAGATLFAYAYLYDDLNRRTRATLADNSYWQYGYDAMGQVEAASKMRADGSPLPGRDYGFTFDTIGNRTSATTNGATIAYEPDALNQYESITMARVVDIFGEAPLNLDMTANGTALMRDGEAFYGQLDFTDPKTTGRPYRAAVTVAGSLAGAGDENRDAVREHRGARYFPPAPYEPVYDDDGNLLDDGRWTYSWNAENRLVAMETHILAATAGVPREKFSFAYDSQGRRFEKKSFSWNGNWVIESHDGYVYDGWNLIAEFAVTPSDMIHDTSYIWGLDLSGTFQGAGGVGGLLCAVSHSSGDAACPYYDGNGNVMGYVDMSSGDRVAQFEYGPFGERIIAKGSKAADYHFGFSTKYTDEETGLLYYGFRYYDVETGRWLSRDPLGEEGGLNLYGFVGNDGLNDADYLGKFSLNLDEIALKADVAISIGWYDAYLVKDTPEIARTAVLNDPGHWGGEADALRHAIWMCEMARKIGMKQAIKVGDIYEKHRPPPTPPKAPKGYSSVADWRKDDTDMDIHNNREGAKLGCTPASKGGCEDLARALLNEGKLKVNSAGGYKF